MSSKLPHSDELNGLPVDDPFPTEVLPEPARRLVIQASQSMSCDPAMIGVPVLPVLAGAIGNTRAIQLKRGWTEPAIVWCSIIAESGSMKSPALSAAVKPLRDAQTKLFADHEQQLVTDDSRQHDRRRRRDSSGGPQRLLVDDVTIPALAPLLELNPRGLLVCQDELAGWLRGVRRGGGADRAHWLSVFNGRAMTVDRKSGPQSLTHVPRASVSVCGGIQPEIFIRQMTADEVASGMFARLLVARPPVSPKTWSDVDLPPEVEAGYALLVERLLGMDFGTDFDDVTAPVVLRLDANAKSHWIQFYNDHASEQAELPPMLAGCWQKLEAYAARFALILHCTEWAASEAEAEPSGLISMKTVERGIQLARWFGRQARRLYGGIGFGGDIRVDTTDDSTLVGIIRSAGGNISPRQLMRQKRQYRGSAKAAEQALEGLVNRGLGSWQLEKHGPRGGRPRRCFVLEGGGGDTTRQ